MKTKLEKIKDHRRYICQGCLIFSQMRDGICCAVPHKINGHPCPCSVCIVKGMCEETCDVLKLYRKTRKNDKTNYKKLPPEPSHQHTDLFNPPSFIDYYKEML